jgi:hypothetical protein
MPCPSHSSRFYHPHKIRRGVQIMKLLIMYFSPRTCYLVPCRLSATSYSMHSDTLHIGGRSSSSNRRTHHVVVTGTLMPRTRNSYNAINLI